MDAYVDMMQEFDALITAVEQPLRAEIAQVYALARGPVEQAKAIPLAQWVQTRFVHIEDYNEKMAVLRTEIERLKAERREFDFYLKDGESPIARLQRERRDNNSLMTLLAEAKRRAEAAEAALAALQASPTTRASQEKTHQEGL